MATGMSAISVVALIARIATSVAVFGGIGVPAGIVGVIVGAAVGLALGLTHGICVARTASYTSDGRGWWLMIVDHTWSLPNTLVGSIYLALNLIFGNRLDEAQSKGRSSLVLRKGIFGGFATTLGNVEAGTDAAIADHEYVHVFQARLLGPLYLPLVGLNYVIATILPYWLLYHDKAGHPIKSFGDYFMRGVYPHVWNEEWAYRVQGSPP